MFTLVAFTESQDTGGLLTYVAGLADQHVRVEGDNIIVPDALPNLAAVMAIGATIKEARIETPALRRMLLYDVPQLNVGAGIAYPMAMENLFYNPIPLDPSEPMRALVAETATGAEQDTVLVWLSDGPQASVSGEIHVAKATCGVTLVPYNWTNAPLSFVQTLPAGRYQVVGLRAKSAGLLAARLVFVGGTWRPGALGVASDTAQLPDVFRRGGLGVWGEFDHDQPPTVDFLSTSADTSETVWLDVIKIA